MFAVFFVIFPLGLHKKIRSVKFLCLVSSRFADFVFNCKLQHKHIKRKVEEFDQMTEKVNDFTKINLKRFAFKDLGCLKHQFELEPNNLA